MRVHVDTDLGSDPDDACALAMLLGLPGVEVVGVTTTADEGGRRAGYVAHLLTLAGRPDVPVVAGAARSLSHDDPAHPVVDDPRHWPAQATSRPASPGAALDLLADSVETGATVLALGPLTNLALLEVVRPGLLGRVPVVAMGGWTGPPPAGLPPWGPEHDWNTQWDTHAAQVVAPCAGDPLTLVTLDATVSVHLRGADLPHLRASGPLGTLLADQGEAHRDDADMALLARRHSGLPDDLVNFHYDPVAAAVSAGWSGVTVEEARLHPVRHDGLLRYVPDPSGRLVRVVVDVDADAFREAWLDAVTRVSRAAQR